MKTLFRIVSTLLVTLALGAGLWYLYRPQPILVDVAELKTGAMQLAIEEDGQTRAHDRFTLAAPVGGLLSRIELHEGDPVSPASVIATITPLPLDRREESELRAGIAAAESMERESLQQVLRVEASLEQARRDLARATRLIKDGDISRQAFEVVENREAVLAKELEAAKFHAASRAAEVKRARAGLIGIENTKQEPRTNVFALRPPRAGRILRILEKSERVVAPGTPIAILSNPGRLEIVADLLSVDAVKVKPGAPAWIENWGGAKSLKATVRTVEPFGFTKTSALGVEEQRVNVILDFLDEPENLGDGYRVDVRIVIWEGRDILQLPVGALFRSGEDWKVFAVEAGKAVLKPIEIGQRNEQFAQVTKGLQRCDQVILYPPNELRPGAAVQIRSNATP